MQKARLAEFIADHRTTVSAFFYCQQPHLGKEASFRAFDSVEAQGSHHQRQACLLGD